MKATISAHGGAVRYWRASDGARLVLCRNGKFLMRPKGGAWRVADARLTQILLDDDRWQSDTSVRARASVTRTGRDARRREGGDHA